MGEHMLKKLFRYYDYSLLVTVLLLTGFGLVMVYSASSVWSVLSQKSPDYIFVKQLIWCLVALPCGLIGMVIPYQAYKSIVKWLIVISAGMLILLFFIGHTANNAQSWFAIGPFHVQPSEIVKVALMIYLASVFANKQDSIENFKTAVAPPLIMIVFFFLLVAKEPDLGTAMIIAGVAGTIILCSGLQMKHLVSLLVLSIAAVAGMFTFFLSKVQSDRFEAAYHPFLVAQTTGHQLINSYIAIASGGLTGKGLGHSVEKAGFLPEPHTDFIIAVIGEELGLLGILFVIFCLAYLVLKGMVIAIRCKDVFGSLLATGISSLIAIQTFVNLGAATGLIPVTGVTLPFVSYGGSSLVIMMFIIGVLINISAFVNMKRSNLVKQGEKGNVTETY